MAGEHRARLDRHAAAAVLPELFGEDMRGVGEGGIGVAIGQAERGGDVRVEIAVRARRAFLGRRRGSRRPPAARRIARSRPPPRPRRCSACRRSPPRPAGRHKSLHRAPARCWVRATAIAGLGSSIGSGALRIGSGRSSAVSTAWTPGMTNAALASQPRSLAWACGERTKQACSTPGSFTSSTKRPRPASERRVFEPRHARAEMLRAHYCVPAFRAAPRRRCAASSAAATMPA